MSEADLTFDITPSPKVLVALTHTPLRPLDAISELIDNALDSFAYAKLEGIKIESPLVDIRIPTPGELRSGSTLSISDNGPGMTATALENAVKAGYSSNDVYGGLGLFGMGLNIATGKLGQLTEIKTKTLDGPEVQLRLDLNELQRRRNYRIPYTVAPPTTDRPHYTSIEIKEWWPDGNPNSGFIKKLCSLPKESIRTGIGRRYATILRRNEVRIYVNGGPCVAFEPCRWADHRFVIHRDYEKIPAYYEFNNRVVGSSRRCTACGTITQEHVACPACGGTQSETRDERISGWVGIQRYDDATEFGIDLIRNGRAIIEQEQDAFFTFVDDLNNRFKEYPDGSFGRIIGEVHLDHVPVEFMKQNFQRTSEEWGRAMNFLRGSTHLAPKSIPEGLSNKTPVFMLFQGYRKVRTGGRRELYMCQWNSTRQVPGRERIDRSVELDYRAKFAERLPGYFDDEEWYKLVESGEVPPQPQLVLCPNCGNQNIPEAEICVACDAILKGKKCINCAELIQQSAAICGICGESQNPKIEEPWRCAVCLHDNAPGIEACSRCGSEPGTEHPTSIDSLLRTSKRLENLSQTAVTIPLPTSGHTQPVDVIVYETLGGLTPLWDGEEVPLITSASLDRLNIFIDFKHPMVKSYAHPEHLISAEVASFLSTRYSTFQLAGDNYSLSALTWQILKLKWGDNLGDDADSVKTDITELFERIRAGIRYAAKSIAEEIYANLTLDQQSALLGNLRAQNIKIDAVARMVKDGEILGYLDNDALIDIFRQHPEKFFDGAVWEEPYENIDGLSPAMLDENKLTVKASYLNCLEDVRSFLRFTNPEPVIVARARGSVDILGRHLT